MGMFNQGPPEDPFPHEQYSPYPQPGRPKKQGPIAFAVIIALIVAGAGYYFMTIKSQKKTERIQRVEKVEAEKLKEEAERIRSSQAENEKYKNDKFEKMDEVLVEKFLEHKIIAEIVPEKNLFFVNETVWNAFDLERKKEFALVFARYCSNHGGGEISILIMGDKSGKKLAYYSEEEGFKEF